MQSHHSCRRRVATSIVACAVGLLLGSCSSSAPELIEVSYACTSPPGDLAGCAVNGDCTTVAIGCYCGAQPVNGVARKYATASRGCEQTAATTCALGCATQPGFVLQDGTMAAAGTNLGARCDLSGATGVCKSYAGGEGDPGSGGW